MASVLIAGGTGLIGRRLSAMLTEQGHRVMLLSRKAKSEAGFDAFLWNPAQGKIDHQATRQADVIINLAGAGIADAHWTPARKREIIDSRVQSTRLLLESIQCTGHSPQCYLSGAAIGIYGDRGEELLDERAAPGAGFLAESCLAWEAAIREVADAGVRTAALRIGIVLSTQGGALEKMLIPARLGAGVYFGHGRQWYSWIHIDDVCRMFIHAMQQESVAGFYNAVAPNPVRNKELAVELQRALRLPPIALPAPALVLRLAMGEMADVVLHSTRVASQKISDAGFRFEHPHLSEALADLLARKL